MRLLGCNGGGGEGWRRATNYTLRLGRGTTGYVGEAGGREQSGGKVAVAGSIGLYDTVVEAAVAYAGGGGGGEARAVTQHQSGRRGRLE